MHFVDPPMHYHLRSLGAKNVHFVKVCGIVLTPAPIMRGWGAWWLEEEWGRGGEAWGMGGGTAEGHYLIFIPIPILVGMGKGVGGGWE